jgi:hypothetical protein
VAIRVAVRGTVSFRYSLPSPDMFSSVLPGVVQLGFHIL